MSLMKKIAIAAGVGLTALCLTVAWAVHLEYVDETTMSHKVFIGDDCFIIPPGYGGGLGGRVGNTGMALLMLRMQYPSLAPFRETKEMHIQHPGQSQFDIFDLIDVSLQYKELNNVSDEEIFRRSTRYANPVKIGTTPDGYDVYKIVTDRLYSKDGGQHRIVISCVQLSDDDSGICHYIAPLWEKDEGKEFYDYALYLAFSKKYIPHLDELVSSVRQKVQSWHWCSIPKVESFSLVQPPSPVLRFPHASSLEIPRWTRRDDPPVFDTEDSP
ncbi:MAG: hypothetical protein ABF672_10940 [Gluconobacter oxydans]|uniref:hypothetical protein n=1 Tax=Gluconobacter oxydans TaxID=442 RepID=UPI0039E84686